MIQWVAGTMAGAEGMVYNTQNHSELVKVGLN